LAGILSVAVVWSELTFFNKHPVLSLFALYVKNASSYNEYGKIEMISTIVILYMGYCAFSTVLKIRIFNLYYLAPHHQTNEYSLIFSGMMFTRLTPPLCLNFLGLIHMDSHIISKQILETHYTQMMGHMDVIKIISNGFNVYFPMAIMFFCVATYFSLGSRILSVIGFHQFISDDEITTDLVNEGRELIKREKRRRQRAQEALNRKQEYQERFARSTATSQTKRDELLESTCLYENVRSEDIDTSDDIDARFGVSTKNIINERYDSSNDLDFVYSEPRTRVGNPPRGIFDDV